MYCINLNFLKEDEVEAIVSVIEKDFEVKAAEKARICKLRKQLINKDHKAELLSQSPFEGSFCVLCCSKFFIIFNPKYVCASCGMQICQSCSVYVKIFNHIVCAICQQQQDLMAMNCSWFYETIRRKFMEGGSQIVANSLSEYPKKNAISPYILNMVKGAQITKFRHQIEDASSTILESLRKVEGNLSDENIKSIRYEELIKRFSENLKMILHNTGQVIQITLENYNKKTGIDNQNITLQVLRILHEEVELLVGKKIDIKTLQEKLRRSCKAFETADLRDKVEMTMANAIVEKLISDHQQFLIETRDLQYDDLNTVLKDIVKNENMDFDYDSISQVPSRHGTVRNTHFVPVIPEPVIEVSPPESDDSSKLYSLSGVGDRTQTVSKQWNEVQSTPKLETNNDKVESDNPPMVPVRLKRGSSLSRKSGYDSDMKVDSDVVTMVANESQSSNWLMNARQPFGSLNSLNDITMDPYASLNRSIKKNRSATLIEKKDNIAELDEKSKIPIKKSQHFGSLNNLSSRLDDPYIAINKNKIKRNPNQRPASHLNLDHDLDAIVDQNKKFSRQTSNISIDSEYKKNFSIATGIPLYKKENRQMERTSSQDSGVVLSQKSSSNSVTPTVRSRDVETPKATKLPILGRAKLSKPQNVSFKKNESAHGSNSSVDSDPNNVISSTRADYKSKNGKSK